MLNSHKGKNMSHIQTLVNRLDELKTEFGDWTFRQAVESIRRRRLDNHHRDHRKRFAWSKYQRLYRRQRGMCPLCNDAMLLLRGQVEIDHKDPNRQEGFNDDDNLQLTHQSCNRRKSSRSIYEQAKKGGKSIIQCL